MPWKETYVMDEKLKFISYYLQNEWSVSDLCREFEISRKTGYKYIHRYEEIGLDGLKEQSKAPYHHPNAVPDKDVETIILLRSTHPTWGPKKLRAWLQHNKPRFQSPSASTIGTILKRNGLAVPRRRSRKSPPYSQPFINCNSSNNTWCADFKGWFPTGDKKRCNPLTITDAYSRYLFRCQHVTQPDFNHVKPIFEAAFMEYGLPLAIRTDNGSPFATTTVAGLSRLSIWWIKLGIIAERIEPGKPSQNGRHERMHKTLKAETAKPPKSNLKRQQTAFDIFRDEFNNQRPHEALKQKTPASVYECSNRPYPLRLPEIEYPDNYQRRKVLHQGDIKWKGKHIYLSETLAGESVGLKQLDDRYFQIYFRDIPLAKLDSFTFKIIKPTKQRKRKYD